MTFHDKKLYEIIDTFKTSITGLTNEEATERLQGNGKNELPKAKQKSLFFKFLMQFKDLMIIVLLVAATASLILSLTSNDGDLIDAIIIYGIVIFNAVMGVTQEQKAESALAKLKNMTQSYAKVVRDGQVINIPTNNLVVGDRVLFSAGDIIPADIYLTESASLQIEEATLTGESHASIKHVADNLPKELPLGDRTNMAYSSTVVQAGRGAGIVVATGLQTEIGKIADLLTKTEEVQTPLQKNLASMGKVITFIVLTIASLIFILDLILTDMGFLNSFMTAIAIAVAAIPESLPAVVTIIMAIGVVKMSKKNAIVKKLHAVETLGACEIICSDKTGTLTQNKMKIKQVYLANTQVQLLNVEQIEKNELDLLRCLTLCNDSIWTGEDAKGDPTENALTEFAESIGLNTNELNTRYPRISEIPFDSDRKLMSTIHTIDEKQIMYTKGAPDNVLNRCTKILIDGKENHLTTQLKIEITKQIETMGENALRVLAFAKKTLDSQNNTNEDNLTYLGIVGMADPVRPLAKSAVQKCQKAGMTPIMITGDHFKTAFSVAQELGIATSPKEVLTGIELDKLTDKQFMEIIKTIKVYARVSPQNKVRIVQGWKSLGKVVAMTGDGVNDAPSLKQAHIGIGMGITGTDVTKDVADVVLSDDNFVTIVIAVEEGRKIFSNIQKTIQFLFSTNLTEVTALVIATILFPQALFLIPIQILFINLVTDSLPAIALGVEPIESDTMNKPPRKLTDSTFSNGVGKAIALQSIAQIMICLGVFIFANLYYGSMFANTMAFITINFMQLFHMFNVKTHKSIFASNLVNNKLFLIAFFVGIALTLTVVLIPPIATAFNLVALNITQWAIIIGASLLIIPFVEIIKFIDNHIGKNN